MRVTSVPAAAAMDVYIPPVNRPLTLRVLGTAGDYPQRGITLITRLLIGLGIAALLVVAGCAKPTSSVVSSASSASGGGQTAEPAEAEAPAVGGVGDTIEFDDGQGNTGTVTLHGAEWASQGDTVLEDRPKNGAFLVLDVEVTATAGAVGSHNPFFWRAQDSAGRTYDAALAVFEGTIDSSDIPAGQRLRGVIPFDVPQGPMTVQMQDPLGGVIATFEIEG